MKNAIVKNLCRNLNHGRSNVTISYCPECGGRFGSQATSACHAQMHTDFRKQRFNFCINCGLKLREKGIHG